MLAKSSPMRGKIEVRAPRGNDVGEQKAAAQQDFATLVLRLQARLQISAQPYCIELPI
jgi:hypothetical protein